MTELLAPWGETRVVGGSIPRVDGYAIVSGTALYTRDVSLPDMLHAAILRCPHAHARIKRIDTSGAMRRPGVRGALTFESPGAELPWYVNRGTAAVRTRPASCPTP